VLRKEGVFRSQVGDRTGLADNCTASERLCAATMNATLWTGGKTAGCILPLFWFVMNDDHFTKTSSGRK
jgi:hypothetical protein